ncbi:MAG: hypothetical protein PHX61_02525 [Alphaproteobacteria bacterium]|nr:hypothetical protein [Alphaproteobacteria bacterium]
MIADKQPKEYIITEHLIKSWREGCPRYDSDVHPQDKCVGCQYDNKIRRACDFDDNEVEKRFRSRPVSTPPVPDSTHLIEMAKTEWKNREERRGIHNREDWCCGRMAGFLSVDKPDWVKAQVQAAREEVLNLVVKIIKRYTTISRYTQPEESIQSIDYKSFICGFC